MPKQTYKTETLAKLRSAFSLGDDVTDDQVAEKAAEVGVPADGEQETPPPAPPKPEDEPKDDEPPAELAKAIATLKGAGISVITDSQLEQLQANATAGAAAATHLAAQRRDQLLDQAEAAGKFGAGDAAKATRTNFSKLLDENFDGAKAVIDSLPSIVPVGELGTGIVGGDATHLSAAAEAALDAEIAAFLGDAAQNQES